MTLFKKKVIYKRLLFHQKMLNCIILYQIFLGEHAPKPPRKGHGFTIMWLCAACCFDTCKFTFQKKILKIATLY